MLIIGPTPVGTSGVYNGPNSPIGLFSADYSNWFVGAARKVSHGFESQGVRNYSSDNRAFGIAGNWKATALKAEVWVETVAEGGRRFIAAWRKDDVDAARHRQKKREATRLEKLLSHTEA